MSSRKDYITKPDPEEPWRYVCPGCGNQVYRTANTRKYRCEKCYESFDKKELEDLTLDRNNGKQLE